MQAMITGKWITGQQDLTAVMEIRQKVFTQEQGFPAEADRDAFDEQAMHALAIPLWPPGGCISTAQSCSSGASAF